MSKQRNSMKDRTQHTLREISKYIYDVGKIPRENGGIYT
jgi:hypothetical protein